MKFPADVNLEKGQLLNARAENIASLPTFVPGEDEGRFLFVTTGGDQGYWFGSSDGTSGFQRMDLGGQIGDYSALSQSINNGVTLNLTLSAATGSSAKKGFVSKVALTSALTSGQVRVEMYEDAARTVKFYDAFFDMANQQIDRFPAYFEVDNASGDVYVDVTNQTGSNGSFDLSFLSAAVVPVTTPPPPGNGSGVNSGVAGDGISYDGANGRLDVDVKANTGLELTGAAGSKELGIKFAAGGGGKDSGSGFELDSAVAVIHGTDQDNITNRKIFAQLGMVPGGSPGAPVAGAHVKGEFYLDSVLDIWQCITAGTPGVWIFWGWKEEKVGGLANGTSYTGAAAAGAGVVLEVPTTGRRGFIRRLLVWGADAAYAASNIDVPFRVVCYPNENREGREQLWSVNGQVRKTYLTAPAAATNNTFVVNTITPTNLDDLLRMRQAAGPLEEYQRVVGRNTGTLTVTIDETLVNSFATNDNVMFVNEYVDLPWRNNSGVGANSQKIYLEFKNDHPSQAVVFGYEVLFESIGGGLPI
jgi:hypothetical protein